MSDKQPAGDSKRSVFQFWRWRFRTWALVLPITLVVYVLSAVPVTFCAHKLVHNRPVQMVLCIPFLPVFACANHSSGLAAVMQWEFKTMAVVFGPP